MKVTIDIFHWEQGELPKVLHTFSHDCHSLETVAAAVQAVIDAPELPVRPDGYRIKTEQRTELYGWSSSGFQGPDENHDRVG